MNSSVEPESITSQNSITRKAGGRKEVEKEKQVVTCSLLFSTYIFFVVVISLALYLSTQARRHSHKFETYILNRIIEANVSEMSHLFSGYSGHEGVHE